MTTYTHSLDEFELDPKASVYIFSHAETQSITLDDPASKAMTDLKHVRAITIKSDELIEYALLRMKYTGVRLLVVIDQSNKLLGLVTARDLQGERSMHVVTKERIKREEVQVGQVMTPRSELNPLDFKDVEYASVRDVILKLQDVARQHIIVVEKNDDENDYFIRGIFSITQIGRQLGMDISVDGHVQSFSEFEKVIAEDVSMVSSY